MHRPKIGMRTIKTAVSVFLCLLLVQIVDRENAFYSCVAAVICMQPTIENSFTKGATRIIGTIIGGLLGALFLIIGKTYLINTAFMFLIPLGIIIIIEACVYLKQREAVSISCVVYLSIMILHRVSGDYFWYTINRIIDTSIGIIIALAVNRFLKLPEFLKKYIKIEKNAIPKEDE